MRIAFISCEYPPDTGKGGIGTYTEQIAKALAGLGWDVHVFAGSQFRQCEETKENVHIHWVQFGKPNNFHLNVLPVFDKQHSLLAFDVMESAEIQGNAWEIKKKYPEIPLVVRLHAPDYLVESLKKRYIPFFAKLRFVIGSIKRKKIDFGYWRPYEKLKDPDYNYIKLANYISAPSNSMKQWAVKNWQINKDDITVIPNIFLPSSKWLNIPVNEMCIHKKVVFFGRLNVLKGLVNSCRAMKKILSENPDWKFRIVGDDGPGPSIDKSMKMWIQDHLKNVNTQLEFIDGVNYDELPSTIAEAEIVLLPSLFESFSYTCAESMAAGKAIVGSKSGGMKDLITDHQSGLLIDPENPADIYNAVNKLIKNNRLRYQLALNARTKIVNEFNSTDTVQKFSSYYKNLSL